MPIPIESDRSSLKLYKTGLLRVTIREVAMLGRFGVVVEQKRVDDRRARGQFDLLVHQNSSFTTNSFDFSDISPRATRSTV